MPKFLVETISMFRMRYVVEALEDTHACDEVTMNNDGNLHEFSQVHLDEIITSTRQLTDEEYISLFNQDNDYLQSWTDEQKLSRVNVIDYTKI
jgi:hypothetical protein